MSALHQIAEFFGALELHLLLISLSNCKNCSLNFIWIVCLASSVHLFYCDTYCYSANWFLYFSCCYSETRMNTCCFLERFEKQVRSMYWASKKKARALFSITSSLLPTNLSLQLYSLVFAYQSFFSHSRVDLSTKRYISSSRRLAACNNFVEIGQSCQLFWIYEDHSRPRGHHL